MKTRIQILLVLFAFAICTTVNAQDENKNVSITVSSSGKTLDDAKQAALRSAIEQAYGAFISSKTEIFNDQVVADQMSSVSSGNIQSYDMLNESQLPDGTWGVTLKALVSISKLKSFVQAKGIAIEIKGGMFAINIKQQLLNEQGEINAVSEMVGLLHEPMQTSFDYVIKSGEPKSLDAESKTWEIPLVVTATTNKNMDFCANYCIKTLAAISLTAPEVETYKTLNKIVLPFTITYKEQTQTFYLRKQISINALQSLMLQWEFYVRGFSVKTGMAQAVYESNSAAAMEAFLLQNEDYKIRLQWAPNYYTNHKDEAFELDWAKFNANPYTSERNGAGKLHVFSTDRYNNNSISFLTTGKVAGTFSWNDKRVLAEIEQMTGYSVKPIGVSSQFKHGGYVVYEKDGQGLVVAVTDLGKSKWDAAKIACDDLVLNGYDDWYLPTQDDLTAIYMNRKTKFGWGFKEESHWSSTVDKEKNKPIERDFNREGYQSYEGRQYAQWAYVKLYTRAVRFFSKVDGENGTTDSSET